MIYVLLFLEFFKIGLFAIGGGLVTVPFLFNLSEKYGWFSAAELTDMIAISESTPGPIGVNMATFAGFNTAGVVGSVIASIGLVLPSFVIMIMVSKMMDKYSCNQLFYQVLEGIRPAVLALILAVGLQIGQIALDGNVEILLFVSFLAMMQIWKRNPIFYICLSAVLGVVLRL